MRGRDVLFVGGGDGPAPVFDSEDVSVRRVETCAAALEAASSTDCIVSQQSLPDGTGVGLCQSVREEDPDLPFVLVVADPDPELAREAVSVGVDEFLPVETLANGQEVAAEVADLLAVDDTHRRYRRLVEQTTDVITVLEPDGTIQYISPSIEETAGYEPSELVGTNAFEMVHPDDQGRVAEAFASGVANDAEELALEYRVEGADGQSHWVETRAQNFTEDPAIEGIVVSSRDISERKERAELYTTLIEEANDGIVIADDEDIKFVNRQMAALLGTTPEDIEGRSVLEFVDERNHEEVVTAYQNRLDGERDTARFELDLRTVDDERVPVEVNTSLVQYDGDVADMAIVRDITARRERERELELYERMLNAVPDMVYALDENGRFVAINRTGEEMVGWSEQELIGRHVAIAMDETDRERGQEHIRELLSDEHREKAIYEMDLYSADGDETPVENHVALLADDEGDFGGSVGVIRDVSERKRRGNRLTVLNRALRHDLRNSMHVILANAELLEREVDEESLMTKLQTIQRRAEDINSLSEKAREIEQTLGEKGQRKPVEIAGLTRNLLAYFREEYPDVTFAADLPCQAWVEAVPLIDTAVENLIENSIEHTADPTIEVDITRTDDRVAVTVADDGPGIPEKERRVVAQGTETPLDHASGLGLWLVAWITRDSGGEVTFEETEEWGSVVTLSLEATETPPEEADGSVESDA